MKKRVIVHRIHVGDNVRLIDVFDRSLLTERNMADSYYFHDVVKSYLNDFQNQAPENYSRNYHIAFPSTEGTNYMETLPPCDEKDKSLINVMSNNFTNKSWDSFKRKYRKLIENINGKDFFNDYEVFMIESMDQWSRAELVPPPNFYKR